MSEKPDLDVGRRVRHVRRGSAYTFIGWGTFQADTEIHRDHDVMAVYAADDGLLAVRPRGEFEDGRFESRPDETRRTALAATLDRLAADLAALEPGKIEAADLERLANMVEYARKAAAHALPLQQTALLAGRHAFAIMDDLKGEGS